MITPIGRNITKFKPSIDQQSTQLTRLLTDEWTRTPSDSGKFIARRDLQTFAVYTSIFESSGTLERTTTDINIQQ